MNNRGSAFKLGDIMVVQKELYPFWWGMSSQLLAITYEEHYKRCPTDAKHIKLLDTEPSWKLIERVFAHFDKIETLIIETFPRGELETRNFSLDLKTLVVMRDFTFNKWDLTYKNIKNLYVNTFTLQASSVILSSIENLSFVTTDFGALSKLKFGNNVLNTFEAYNVTGESKALNFTANNLRIHARFYNCLTFTDATLLQFYGRMHTPSVHASAINSMRRLRDVIFCENMFNVTQIAQLKLHPDCIVGIPNTEVEKYVGKFKKFNLTSIASPHQMCVYDGETLTCNFKITRDMFWTTVVSRLGKKIVIRDEAIVTDNRVVIKKRTVYELTPTQFKISITSKTTKELLVMLREFKWDEIETLSIQFLDVEKTQPELDKLNREIQLNLKKMKIEFFNHNNEKIGNKDE